MRKRSRNRLKPQNGQALIEFAMTLPVTLLVIFSLIGFAYLFYAYATMNLAVRDAANYIVHNADCNNTSVNDAAVRTQVRSSMVTLDPNSVGIDIYPSNPNPPTNCAWLSGVRVSVTGYFTLSMPIEALGTVQFQAQSVMSIE